jgi:hypothetical protein
MLLRRLAFRHRLVGIIVFELVERKRDALREADRLGDRIGRIAEQPRHFVRRFQMPLGIGFQQAARRIERHMLADAGDDILQFAPLGA